MLHHFDFKDLINEIARNVVIIFITISVSRFIVFVFLKSNVAKMA